MAFCRVLLPLLVVSVVQSYAAVEVPVYLWGDLSQLSIKHTALNAVPSNEFRIILKQELQDDPFTVVFIEETLSVEDFSSKIDGESAFLYLQANIGNALYLPSAEGPLSVLNKFADPEKVDHVKLTDNGLSADINREGGKFLFINLKDAKEGESREELLRRHNDFMEDMFSKLQERYDKVVAIYTAHYPSWTIVDHSRVRRQAEATPAPTADTPAVTNLNFSGLRIYFEQALLSSGLDMKTVTLEGAVGSDADSTVNDTTMVSTITFSTNNTKVSLDISKDDAGYWLLNSARLTANGEENELIAQQEVFALLGFSYRCAQDVSFSTLNATTAYTFTFKNMRMEPFFTNNDTDFVFGDMFNCVGFFTAPIWAGLMVAAILLSITFYGIMMMFDIRTMDRFDDPKGKTITINAASD